MRLKRGSLNKLTLVLLIFTSILILTFYLREADEGVLHRTQLLTINSFATLQSGVSKIVSPFNSAWKLITSIGNLEAENQQLKKELVKLKQQIVSIKNMEMENKRLRTLVGFKGKTHYHTLPAVVVGRSTNNWQSAFVIDKGSKDGIKKNMVVLVGEGLVGQVVMVSSHASKVQLIIDQKSGVAAQLMNSGETGIVEGQVTGELVMNYISKDIEITKNEPILTSGLGGIFPKGLFIGTVSEVKETPYDLYKQVRVKTHVNFSGLEEVLVITELVPAPSFLSKEGE